MKEHSFTYSSLEDIKNEFKARFSQYCNIDLNELNKILNSLDLWWDMEQYLDKKLDAWEDWEFKFGWYLTFGVDGMYKYFKWSLDRFKFNIYLDWENSNGTCRIEILEYKTARWGWNKYERFK